MAAYNDERVSYIISIATVIATTNTDRPSASKNATK